MEIGSVERIVRGSLEYARKHYSLLRGSIEQRRYVAALTSGWVKSPGCVLAAAHATMSLEIRAFHADLEFFARYIAPYGRLGEEDLGLVVFSTPSEPWRSRSVELVRALSAAGYSGVYASAELGEKRGLLRSTEFEVMEIPGNADPILAYHLAALMATSDLSSGSSARASRIRREVEEIDQAIPELLERYRHKLEDLGRSLAEGVGVLVISTCPSRSFAEGLVLDGREGVAILDPSEILAAHGRGKVLVTCSEAERDLALQARRAAEAPEEIVLRTDPLTSPTYFRILSLALKAPPGRGVG